MTPHYWQIIIILALILIMWPCIVRALMDEWHLSKQCWREWKEKN